MSRDPYTVLGVNKNATEQEIKKAYRNLARELHPDVNPGNKKVEERFKEVTNAYNFLTDKDTRAKYDRGEIDADGQQKIFRGNQGGFNPEDFAGGFNGFNNGSYKSRKFDPNASYEDFDFFSKGGDSFGGFSDFFSNFKSAKNRAPKTDGANVTYSLTVSFTDAALGITKEVSLANGKKIKVKIPEGTEDGATLRLKGQGMSGSAGGKTGDALITIKVSAHKYFERDDNNIIVKVPISLKEAVLGAKITIPTLDGKVSVSVPKNTSDSTLRLRGKGIKTAKGQGDLLVKLFISLPSPQNSDLESFVKSWKGADYNPRNF